MDELYRWNEPTQQWVKVTNVNRIEVSGGGNMFENMSFFPSPELSTINEVDIAV